MAGCFGIRFAALLSRKTWASEVDELGITTVYWFLSHAQAPWSSWSSWRSGIVVVLSRVSLVFGLKSKCEMKLRESFGPMVLAYFVE